VVSQILKIGTPIKSRKEEYIEEKIFLGMQAEFDMCLIDGVFNLMELKLNFLHLPTLEIH